MLKEVTTIVAFLFVIIPARSAVPAEDPSAIVEAFLGGLVAGKLDSSFSTLMTYSTVDEAKPLEVQALRGQMGQVLNLYGNPMSFEPILRKPSGSSVLRLVYLTKHRDIPLVWTFFFYRPSDQWRVQRLFFNDQFSGLE